MKNKKVKLSQVKSTTLNGEVELTRSYAVDTFFIVIFIKSQDDFLFI